MVYQCLLDLPHRGEARQADLKLVPSMRFRGFAGLLDVKDAFYAFSRTVGRENAAFIGDSKTAATVYLEPNTNIHIDMSQFAAQYDLCRVCTGILDFHIALTSTVGA